MQSYRPAADRTRSKRWRSGTRRNKRNTASHQTICPQLGVCLVHTPGYPDMILGRRPRAMAMKLTPCEQAWVDDVRSGHVHIHLRRNGRDSRRERRYRAVRLVYREMNTERMRQNGTVNEYRVNKLHDDTRLRVGMGLDFGYHQPVSGLVSAMDVAMTREQKAMMEQAMRRGR